MRICNVLGNQNIFLIFNNTVFLYHFNTTATCRIGRFHNPQGILVCILAYHLESLKIEWKNISCGYKVICLWVGPALLIKIFPHVILAAQLPTPREMIHLLVSVHSLQSLLVSATNIKEHVPFITPVAFSKTIEF